MNKNDLPEGVFLCPQARRNVTLANCSAIQFYFESHNGTSRTLIVWKDGPKHLRPVDSGKPIRDIRPSDKVWCFDKIETVTSVEIYR